MICVNRVRASPSSSGNVPLGYRVENRKLVVEGEEAGLVRSIFERFVAIGSATRLAQALAGERALTRRGKPIDKGTIYKLLNNRVYLGEAVHKGVSYPGEHEAIIANDLWDKAHSILETRPRTRAANTRAQTPALLKGLIFAEDGRAMSPTHTRKGGRLYRYYVAQSVLKHGADESMVSRLPASEVETAVMGQIRHLVRTPEIVAATWKAEVATVVFIDLAGFSSITDVYGDSSAIAMLELFEGMVGRALEGNAPPIKWIGDEVMLSFPTPQLAVKVLGKLLTACRDDPRLPLTRTALHHGPVTRRAHDLFGATVNIAARIAALAGPGQILTTRPVADVASAEGIRVTELGETNLRSLPDKISLFEINLAPAAEAAWIDPVCKMHAPYSSFVPAAADAHWFCSKRCADAYARSPETYTMDRR